MAGASVPDQEATVVHASVLSNNPGTDLEDKLCHLSPLPEVISPLPESGNDVPMSPSLYPAMAVPAMDPSVSATWVSPTPLRVVNTLPTIDVFPTYSMSPAISS